MLYGEHQLFGGLAGMREAVQVRLMTARRIEKVQNTCANYVNAEWIESLTAASERSRRLSPPAFRYQLTELARKAIKRVVLRKARRTAYRQSGGSLR